MVTYEQGMKNFENKSYCFEFCTNFINEFDRYDDVLCDCMFIYVPKLNC
jgi:hypothetical protein